MITKDNSYKVIKLFFDNPDATFHIREIARRVRLSPPSILKMVGKLGKEGLLLSEKTSLVTQVRALKNEKFLLLKRCYNLLNLHELGLVEFLRHHYEEPEAIVLLGSFSKGEDGPKSDVDIAVVTSMGKMPRLKEFERKIARKISLHEIQIEDCTPQFLNSLANGIVLHGHLRLVR